MGPQPTSSDNATKGLNPPRFVTNQTNKTQYRDTLKTWAEIIRGFAEADPKAKARLDMMGLIIYLACDDEAKAKLRAEETEKRMNLKGDVSDPNRSKLLEKILETIAHETASERIQREVALLNDIHQCKREKNEDPGMYANKFEARIAKYVHQKNTRSPSDDQQWALLLLQNADLTADTRNSITFQLTTGAAMRKVQDTPTMIDVDKRNIEALRSAIKEADAAETQEETAEAMKLMKQHMEDIENRAERDKITQTPNISFSEAANALKKVQITKQLTPTCTTMMARRMREPEELGYENPIRKRARIEEIKGRTKCMACGLPGHCFKDNPRCMRMMDEKLASRDKNNASSLNKSDDKQKKPFFRPRGQ